MYIQKKMFVSCNCMLMKIRTKLIFKGHCAIGQEKKKEREKEKNHQKGNEETFSSLFHGKFIG